MGFRDPVNSLSGDQIAPGVITGSTIQTSATGRRIVISADGQIESYSGDPGELTPALVYARIEPGTSIADPGVLDPTRDRGLLVVSSPRLGSSMYSPLVAQIVLTGGTRDASDVGQVDMGPDVNVTGALSAGPTAVGSLTINGNPAHGAKATTCASYATSTTEQVLPGSILTLGAGRWLVSGKGYFDWAVGSGSPRFIVRLKKTDGTTVDTVQLYIGAAAGAVPFLVSALVTLTAPTDYAYITVLSNNWSGGAALLTAGAVTAVAAP